MYDLIILGAGPAGLASAIYSSRYKINHLLIGQQPGGYLSEIHRIDNYPGLPEIAGFELAQKMQAHAEKLGSKIIFETAIDIKKRENFFEITTGKNFYQTKNVIFAVGSKARQLNIPGEERLLGKGVCYCATCDAPFFRGKTVAVVGAANAAASATLLLSEYAQKVYMLVRKELTCNPSFADQITKDEKIEVLKGINVKEINGEQKVVSVTLDMAINGKSELPIDGIFVEIGSEPNAGMLKLLKVELSEQNFVKTNADQSTNVPGIFAAGDLTTNSNGFRQIVTAVSEGAIAALSVYNRTKTVK